MTAVHIRRQRTEAVTAAPKTKLIGRRLTTTRQRSDTSRQVDVDYGMSIAGGTTPLSTPYDIGKLYYLYETSNMLRQCVAAMVTNVALCGWEVVPAVKGVPIDPQEAEELQSFIDSPNSEETFTALHAKVVEDKETLGFSFVEVIRDKQGRPSIWRHAPAANTRLCPKDPNPVLVTYDVIRGPRTSVVREYRTFRIYVQETGGRRVYFKEMGDPRKLHADTGRFASQEYPVPSDREATELIHFRFQSPDPYGLPRWINQIPSILGSREAEEVNLRYFEDNTVPPAILTVAGGRLTAESFRDLKKLLSNQGVGKERQNQILLLEAVPERESLDDKGTVQLKLDKLTDARPSDALFREYDESNQAKIRSSFRLPPVAIGLSQDTTFATANVSTFVAESQVYAPERQTYDEVYNKRLIESGIGLRLKTARIRSKNPAITNPETLLKALTALNVMGALTPRSAQIAAANALRTELVMYPEVGEEGYEEWMDIPIAITLRDSVKNTQNEQSVKDQSVKDVEDDGDVLPRAPEHGNE